MLEFIIWNRKIRIDERDLEVKGKMDIGERVGSGNYVNILYMKLWNVNFSELN